MSRAIGLVFGLLFGLTADWLVGVQIEDGVTQFPAASASSLEFVARDITNGELSAPLASRSGVIDFPDLVVCGDTSRSISLRTELSIQNGGAQAVQPLRVKSITTGCGCTAATTERGILGADTPLVIESVVNLPPVSAGLRKSLDVVIHFESGSWVQLRRVAHLFPTFCVDNSAESQRSSLDAGIVDVARLKESDEFSALIPVVVAAKGDDATSAIARSLTVSKINSDVKLSADVEWSEELEPAEAMPDDDGAIMLARGKLNVTGKLGRGERVPAAITVRYQSTSGVEKLSTIHATFQEPVKIAATPASLILAGERTVCQLLLERHDGRKLAITAIDYDEQALSLTKTGENGPRAEFEIRYLPPASNGVERYKFTFVTDEQDIVSVPAIVVGVQSRDD